MALPSYRQPNLPHIASIFTVLIHLMSPAEFTSYYQPNPPHMGSIFIIIGHIHWIWPYPHIASLIDLISGHTPASHSWMGCIYDWGRTCPLLCYLSCYFTLAQCKPFFFFFLSLGIRLSPGGSLKLWGRQCNIVKLEINLMLASSPAKNAY